MKIFAFIAMLASMLVLDGCYTPIVEGAQEGYDAVRRDPLRAEAAAGAPNAQYELGDSYCCHGGGPMDGLSVYDNYKATYWYCQAARQGYGPAQMRLANVYSGHPIHGLHIALRASALIGAPETDMAVALMWASVAAGHGVKDATALHDAIDQHATAKDRTRASSLLKNWRTAPCIWAEVFPVAGSAIR
jgi:hypothetical protein